MIDVIVYAGLALAAFPAVMSVVNLALLADRSPIGAAASVAVLVPARNEEATIGDCVEAALRSEGVDIEVVVMDDGSTDRTSEIVTLIAARDRRVTLVATPELPRGWNGKQHACHALSTATERPLMLFIDADVRLAPEGAARLAARLRSGRFALVSGVPRQAMKSFWELLLIPMINMLLLGYLPVLALRRSGRASLGAGCGQMIMVRRNAYVAAGGHGVIRTSMHDGLKLPRAFRASGFMTDLVDGTKLAECRMYADGPQLIAGFMKNATEGMATPRALPVWTVLLFGGHVAPWFALPFALGSGRSDIAWAAVAACALPICARALQAWRCREPVLAVALHPIAVSATLVLQWVALIRHLRGGEATWRGRSYKMES